MVEWTFPNAGARRRSNLQVVRAVIIATLVCLAFAGAGHSEAGYSTGCPRSGVVLGSVRSYGPYSHVGWGTCAPRYITNGGDMASQASRIHWSRWGGRMALGRGVTWLDTNAGAGLGPVPIELRASVLGRCSPSGPRAYRRLEYRAPKRVGGPLSRWTIWVGDEVGHSKTICNAY